MDATSGVQTQDERVLQGDEGVGQPDPGTSVEQQPTPVDESVPPELRPDKDGNPPKLTPELLRKLRGKYFTVKHPFLNDCGHRLDMINEPRHRNCENCWWQWFNTHPGLIEVADQMFRTQGKTAMVNLRGKKFVQMFVRYMATVYHFMKEEGRLNESDNQQAVSGAESTGLSSGIIAE